MNKDLEQFENRSDDWLAKERKHESRVSAWDFDEGKELKEEHEENCEAREIKERHEQIHSGKINPNKKEKASPLVPFILFIVAIDVIPSIFADKDITLIPLNIIGAIVFLFAIVSILKKGRK